MYCKYIFRVKIQLFVILKSDHDPDPHGSALVWIPGSGFALRKEAAFDSRHFYKIKKWLTKEE
jgi:hypothetical protein